MRSLPADCSSFNLYQPFVWVAGFSTVLAVKYAGVGDDWSQGMPATMIAAFLFEACVEGTAVSALPFFAIRHFKGNTVFAHPSEYLWMILGAAVTVSLISFAFRRPTTILVYSGGAFLAAWICRHHTWKWLYLTLGVLGWIPTLPPLAWNTALDYYSCAIAALAAHVALTASVLVTYTLRYSPTRCGFVGFATQLGVVVADLGLLLSLRWA